MGLFCGRQAGANSLAGVVNSLHSRDGCLLLPGLPLGTSCLRGSSCLIRIVQNPSAGVFTETQKIKMWTPFPETQKLKMAPGAVILPLLLPGLGFCFCCSWLRALSLWLEELQVSTLAVAAGRPLLPLSGGWLWLQSAPLLAQMIPV